jgi:hypothetical protein
LGSKTYSAAVFVGFSGAFVDIRSSGLSCQSLRFQSFGISRQRPLHLFVFDQVRRRTFGYRAQCNFVFGLTSARRFQTGHDLLTISVAASNFRIRAGKHRMATFEIADRAQMRRCRRAQLLGCILNELFEERALISGYVRSIRPHLTPPTLRWTVTVLDEQTVPRRTLVGDRARGNHGASPTR